MVRTQSLTTVALIAIASSPVLSETVTFEDDVRPILRVHCFHCHGDDGVRESDLDLRLRRLMLLGGKKGPAIVPGDSGNSHLLELVKTGKMPEKGKPLGDQEIAVIERWIAAGAPTLHGEPEDVSALDGVSEADRAFWSFRPIQKPVHDKLPAPAPGGRTTIDSHIHRKLAERGLMFSPEADKRTLIRRLYFDLLGLPPRAEDVERFVTDPRPDAYERLVDRLLVSPAYGERWGRHWLDVAGYADSEGYTAIDPERPHAFRYRDYIIHAFNTDRPWDQMILEQLAGDEAVAPPRSDLTEEQKLALAATGFLRTAPDGSASGVEVAEAANANIADTIRIVASSLLGLTVGCAQCHTHKYDPIPQTDYYRLRAVFEPALNAAAWRPPAQRLVSTTTSEEVALAQKIEAQAAAIDAKIEQREAELIEIVLNRELEKIAADQRETVLATRNTPPSKRTDEQKALAQQFVKIVNLNKNTVQLYEPKFEKERDDLRKQAADIRATKPTARMIHVCDEPPGVEPPVTRLLHRGDPAQPKETVEPGVLSVTVAPGVNPIPANDPSSPFTGRRSAYAKHLTSGDHPLTARVLVNRFWSHHFGRGIVATLSDFGATGEPPSHPELLDFLAADFMENGWSLKHLHRMIVTSSTYRQSSRRHGAGESADPDNTLLWRMPVRRLEAEAMRDAMLVVTGDLVRQIGGEPVPVAQAQTGQVVIGIDKLDGSALQVPETDLGGREYRRSIYIQVRRSKPLSVLEVFDLPDMQPNCDQRRFTTTTPQSLVMMNAEETLAAADRLAKRIENEAGFEPAAQVDYLWRLTLARTPEAHEASSALAFLDDQARLLDERNPAPVNAAADTFQQRQLAIRHDALASLCQAVLGSNAFLYLD